MQKQLNKEIRFTLYLAIIYILGWIFSAYFLPNKKGFLGFPIWFEMACIVIPIIFILLTSFTIKFVFKEIELEDKK